MKRLIGLNIAVALAAAFAVLGAAEKTEDLLMHPLWFGPMLLMFSAVLIQTLHTLTHWRMEIDADSYCRNNAEWVEQNTGGYDEDY